MPKTHPRTRRNFASRSSSLPAPVRRRQSYHVSSARRRRPSQLAGTTARALTNLIGGLIQLGALSVWVPEPSSIAL